MTKIITKAIVIAGAAIIISNVFVASTEPFRQEGGFTDSSALPSQRWFGDIHEITLIDGMKLAGTVVAQTPHLITIATSDGATIGIPVRLVGAFDGKPYPIIAAGLGGNGPSSSREGSGAQSGRNAGQGDSTDTVNRSPGISAGASINDLVVALRSPQWQKRSSAARELGVRSQWESGAIDALSALLGDNVMESSLLQVHQVDSQGQAKLLSPGLEAAKALAAMESRGYAELARQMLSMNPLVRQRAAFGLGETNNNRCVPILLKALKDRDPLVRTAAAGALHFSEATPELIKAIDDNDEKVRAGAVTALGRIGDAASGTALANALDDVNPWVRAAAAEALGKIKSPTAIYPLSKIILDPEKDVRLSAVVALSCIRDTATVPPLITCLKDRDGSVVRAAAVALGDIRDPRAIEPLRSALKRCPESARNTVGISLKLLTEIPLLIGALDDRDTLVRRNAEYLLWLITGKRLGYDKKAWADWFVSRSDNDGIKKQEPEISDSIIAPASK